MDLKTDILDRIDGYEDELISFAGELIKIPAISPASGGAGELKKTEFIQRKLEEIGFDKI